MPSSGTARYTRSESKLAGGFTPRAGFWPSGALSAHSTHREESIVHAGFAPPDRRPAAATLSDWFQTPLGQYLLQREFAFFDAEVVDAFGFHALQLGVPDLDFLRMNRMSHRATLALDSGAAVRADFCELPIATASVDLVVLPHTLEFSQNPHQVLREVQRVLVPEGQMVISGFNPWSLWGATRWMRRRKGLAPWDGQFISVPRIKDWLALLGFELSASRMGAYVPPCRGETWLHRLRFMEYAGDRWWPIAGGVYFLRAIKRIPGAKLITPRWRMSAARKKALAAVPQNVAHARQGHCEADRPNEGDGQ